MKASLYYILLFFSLLSIAIIPLFVPSGGIAADSISYFRLANDLPEVKWSLFPLGYPVLLKIFNFIFEDFYWSGRVLNIVLFLVIAVFSYYKKFYFRATVILLSTKIFFFNFYNSTSEGLFLTCLYFLMYYLHGFFQKKKGANFFVPAAICLAISFTIRYSALYIFIGMGLFYLFYYFKNKSNIQFFRNDFFKFLLLSGLGILMYGLFNFFSFGDFMGEKFRNSPPVITTEDVLRNISSVFNSFNPVLGIKLVGNGKMVLISELVFFVINIIFIYFFIKIWKRYLKKNNAGFHLMLIFTGIVYTIFLFVTQFFQGIEELNMRMLSESSFLYFFSVIVICFKEKRYEKVIFMLAVFSLVFNSLYTIKSPENYLARKNKIEQEFEKMNGKKYFYDDLRSESKTVKYHIPVIDKEFEYVHLNQQDGYIDGNIVMTRNPEILWILKDTVKDKSQVVYSTDLNRKAAR